MDKEPYPDFIAYYRDNIENEESYREFLKLSREFNNRDAKLDRQAGTRITNLELKMDNIGKFKTADVSGSKSALREEYKNKADETARQHGFTGLSYYEHIKEKEKRDNKEPVQSHEQEATSSKATEKPLTDREKEKQEFKRKLEQIQENNKTLGKQHDR